MATINLSAFTNEAASRIKGEILKEKLETYLLDNQDISVDFTGITRFASPFFNNSFAALAIIFGFEQIEKITLLHLSEIGQRTYDTSMQNAKLIYEKPEFTNTIQEILNKATKKVN